MLAPPSKVETYSYYKDLDSYTATLKFKEGVYKQDNTIKLLIQNIHNLTGIRTELKHSRKQ